jgi:hypothetical protein
VHVARLSQTIDCNCDTQPLEDKAPEVLTTPGASFLGSGGRYARVCPLPVPLLLPVMGLIGARMP